MGGMKTEPFIENPLALQVV